MQLGKTQDEVIGLFIILEVFPVESGLLGPRLFLGKDGLRPCELSLGGDHGSLEVLGIEFQQHLALGEKGPILESRQNADDLTGYLCRQGDLVVRPYHAARSDTGADVFYP